MVESGILVHEFSECVIIFQKKGSQIASYNIL